MTNLSNKEERFRIFAAIELSPEARRAAAGYVDSLRREFPQLRVGWERPEKFHLTLKFLAEARGKQLAALENAVREPAGEFSPFVLSLVGCGAFPNRGAARVLWLGIGDKEGRLRELQKQIELLGQMAGLPAEKREFNPHLTVARLREPKTALSLTQHHLKQPLNPVEFAVYEIVIIRSFLEQKGSRYEVLSRYKFEAAN
jgi:2'-5' RNA ligase